MNKEISATEASNLKQSNSEILFLDVREHSELDICRIEGALHIPIGEIPERMGSLPRDKTIIIFCHHGMRSANIQQYLEASGFENLINMGGGIHAWSHYVDPEVPTY